MSLKCKCSRLWRPRFYPVHISTGCTSLPGAHLYPVHINDKGMQADPEEMGDVFHAMAWSGATPSRFSSAIMVEGD